MKEKVSSIAPPYCEPRDDAPLQLPTSRGTNIATSPAAVPAWSPDSETSYDMSFSSARLKPFWSSTVSKM